MNTSSNSNEQSAPITEEEYALLSQLRANPIAAKRFRTIMSRFEQEVASGMDAHEAEMMVIEEIQQLGRSLLDQWAENTHKDTIEQARRNDPGLLGNGKKTPVVFHLRNHCRRRAGAAREPSRWKRKAAFSGYH
ncbi:MAG: hypothetical protein L3J39_17995 [Verrucomicrobiales bacterium]|nr:hypothetical protein [Verrucomicrobiales bacterium]